MQINLPVQSSENGILHVLFGRLTRLEINLPFMCQGVTTGGTHTSLCMSAGDFPTVAALIEEVLGQLDSGPDIIPSVGTLTVFPHQSSLKILGTVLSLFGQHNLPVHGLCTSISALAVNTDYQLLDRGAEVLQTVFRLPDNHSPFRQQLPRRLAEQIKKSW